MFKVRTMSVTSKGLKESAKVAVQCLDSLEDLIKIPYSLPKLDHAAVFSFAAGEGIVEMIISSQSNLSNGKLGIGYICWEHVII